MTLGPRRTFVATLTVLVALAGCGEDEPEQQAQPPSVPLVASLGDSITAGAPRWNPNLVLRQYLAEPTPQSQWQHWAEQATNGRYRFRNCGRVGERTDQIALRLEECAEGADVLVLQGGTNDVMQGRGPASAAANIRAMLRRAEGAGLTTLVTTTPPINTEYPRWADEVRRLNALIRALAREEGVSVIDFFRAIEDPRRPDRMPERWTVDGVHPTVEGYSRLGRAAARVLGRNPAAAGESLEP